jgi:hypothetical protein
MKVALPNSAEPPRDFLGLRSSVRQRKKIGNLQFVPVLGPFFHKSHPPLSSAFSQLGCMPFCHAHGHSALGQCESLSIEKLLLDGLSSDGVACLGN